MAGIIANLQKSAMEDAKIKHKLFSAIAEVNLGRRGGAKSRKQEKREFRLKRLQEELRKLAAAKLP